jgi:dTDP-4-dehydrorhamnose reductase
MVVADQYGAPTSAELVADVPAFVIHRMTMNATMLEQAAGTYHLAAAAGTN